MLDDYGDVQEHVVKWMVVLVGQYLEMGSPPQDYTGPERSFVKSIQWDINVGGILHNIRAHKKEQEILRVRWIETHNDGSFERHEFLRFVVLYFGGRSLPYLACQAESRILEACMGDCNDPSNTWQ